MNKNFILIVTVASLFIGAYLAKDHNPGLMNETRETGNVLEILPGNTEFMLKLGSVETVYKHLSVTENSFFGKPVDDIEKIKNKLGFNPLIISELEANGVDTKKEIGFLINGFKWKEKSPAAPSEAKWEQTDATNLFFIPVTNGLKVAEKLKILIKNEIPTVKFSQEGPFTVFSKENEGMRGYIFEKGAYLFIGMNPKADAKPLMTSVMSGKISLSDTKSYQDMAAKANDQEEFFVYANIKKIAENNQAAIQNISDEGHASYVSRNFKHLKDCESAGVSIDLESNDFAAKSVFNMVPGSTALNMVKDIKFDKSVVLGVKENPALLLSFSINVPEYYKMISETLTQADMKKFKENLEKIRTDFGVDIEKDVVKNLAGNFNLGIYDSASINMFNYNALSTLAIKDGAKMKAVIDTAVSKLSPEKQAVVSKTILGNDEAYIVTMFGGMTQLYAGVKENNLILSVGKLMFEKAADGNMASGFISAIKDKPLADKLKGDTNLFYINIGEILKAAKNFPFLTQHSSEKTWEAIRQFEYVLSTGKIKGNSVYSNFLVKTKFSESFFKGVQKVSKELEMDNEDRK